MFCKKGYGLIYRVTDGQRRGDFEEVIATAWMNKWWNGDIKELDEVDYQKTKLAAQIIIEGDNEEQKRQYTPYISYETIQTLTNEGLYNKDMCTPFIVADLNRILQKYGITSKQNIEYFLAESLAEGMGVTPSGVDGFAIENGSVFDYLKHDYYPYIGVGAIQLTNKYSYISFVIYKVTEAEPELKEVLEKEHQYDMRNSSMIKHELLSDDLKETDPQKYKEIENDPNNLTKQYHTLKKAADERGIDIKAYTDIIDKNEGFSHNSLEQNKEEKQKPLDKNTNIREQLVPDGTYCLAKYFPWETGAYYWTVNDMNQYITESPKDSLTSITRKIVGDVSDNELQKRERIYNELKTLESNGKIEIKEGES